VKRKSYLLIGGIFMWIITLYSNSTITMFEYDTQEEAREAFANIAGFKILSEIVYFTDKCFAAV
jgi:ArsR family metal-binding transcriptional regulator